MENKYYLSLILTSLQNSYPTCHPGSLDRSFNPTSSQPGSICININNYINSDNQATNLKLQADHKILIGGFTAIHDNEPNLFALARLTTDGELDPSFNPIGLQPGTTCTTIDQNPTNNCLCQDLAIQSDHKIIMAGYLTNDSYDSAKFALARLNLDGSLDCSFNPNGPQPGTASTTIANHLLSKCYAVIIDNNQRIILGGCTQNPITGYQEFAIARFNLDGSLDSSFNPNGPQPGTTSFKIANNLYDCIGQDINIDQDGKILIAGYSANLDYSTIHFALARLHSDGSLDTSFNPNGIQPGTNYTKIACNNYNFCCCMAINKDRAILLAGLTALNNYSPSQFAIACFTPTGELATNSFNAQGIAPGTFATSINQLATYHAAASALTIQPNQKIILAGYLSNPDQTRTEFALLRLNKDGTLDATFNPNGSLPGTVSSCLDAANDYNLASAIALQPDGKILTAGISKPDSSSFNQFRVARFVTIPSFADNHSLLAKLINKYNQHI